jgi:hypothetical protein
VLTRQPNLVRQLFARPEVPFSPATREAVKGLLRPGPVTVDRANTAVQPEALRGVRKVARAKRQEVITLGPGLGDGSRNLHAFAESLKRRTHVQALLAGWKAGGSPLRMLDVAEMHRAHGHRVLKRGTTVVVNSTNFARDAAAIEVIRAAVERAGGKLVVTGRGGQELAVRKHAHRVEQQQQQRRHDNQQRGQTP